MRQESNFTFSIQIASCLGAIQRKDFFSSIGLQGQLCHIATVPVCVSLFLDVCFVPFFCLCLH